MEFLLRQSEGGGEHAALQICKDSASECILSMPPDCDALQCREHFTILIFPFLALFIGVLSMPLSRLIHIPYTLFLLFIGIVIGLIGCRVNLSWLSVSLLQWVHLNPPTIFFYIFLAPLIFEASFNARWHVFKRLLMPILTAAFLIVILQCALIASFQMLVIRYDGWNWWAALMFGSMLSATDPISVTATLKALGASEFLNTLIEGESLVNDGSAFVLWEAFIENTIDSDALSKGEIVLMVFKLSLGGMLMGVAFGIISLVILGLVYDEFEVETSLTVIVAFLGFWTAQSPSKLSGVICNVASGLTISAFGRHLITPAVRGPLAEFWELLGWIANTIVFVHAGLLLSAFSWSCAGEPNTYVDYLLVFGYYLFLQFIRMGLMLIFQPLMSVGNKWYRWKEAVVVGFSGLRGAVSLVLALEVAGKSEIDERIKSRVVLWATGVVALSLLVNGFLIKPLIKSLKLDKAKKSREDFLHRARAIMVQRSFVILDRLCIETGFKSARWSYVVKNVLLDEWLEDSEHGDDYREALEQIMDNNQASHRKSLEIVGNEARLTKMHNDFTKRISMGQVSERYSLAGTADLTAHSGMHAGSPVMFTGALASPRGGVASPSGIRSPAGPLSMDGAGLVPLSLGMGAMQGGNYSLEGGGTNRRSIDADVARYQRGGEPPEKLTQARIHLEVAALHRKALEGQTFELSDDDREVQRRLLTAILSHVRAISNASLVEFNVLHNLEEDCQLALDANDEGKDYDLFSFLDNRGRQTGKNPLYKSYLRLIEGKRLKGQTSITTAVLVFGILTEILKAEILHSSPIVQLQAEHLYEAAAALLNRLETLNPYAFEWVQSQFAIYVTSKKQDEVLSDMLASGIVDQQEYGIIHEELVHVRRDHVRSRHSLFYRGRNRLAVRPKPRAMVREHPLFSGLPMQLMSSIVDRYGELVHLKGGQSVQADKGSLVLVLEGAIRPLEDHSAPGQVSAVVAGQLQPNNSSGSGSAVEERGAKEKVFTPLASGATMHWCFPAHNGFCSPTLTLHAHAADAGGPIAIAQERATDSQFCCCEIAGDATVFTLAVNHVRRLAQESETFRMEITRSLAREIVLESVSDQRPYSLAHFMDASGAEDVSTVVGRAFRVLERLPYMTVLALEAGETSASHVQGPGVLLNGKVRVSIVDTSGLVGAVNLLHEELTGPALLPSGGLILQEVHNPDGTSQVGSEVDDARHHQPPLPAVPPPFSSDMAVEAAEAAQELLEFTEKRRDSRGEVVPSRVLAHVLIEEISETDVTALRRLKRWSGRELQIDMNGRFGMFRHVDMHSFNGMKVE